MTSLSSGLPDAVGEDEDLARFLTQSGHFNSTKQQIDPSAFLPSKKSRETSVSRHGPEPREVLRSLGLAAAGNRTLYGAAIFKGRDVRSAALTISPNEPPARHAVIRGWPWFDSDLVEQKAQQKERALVLVSSAGQPLMFNW